MTFHYHLDTVPPDLLAGMEQSVVECFRAQASKLGAIRDKIPDGDTVETLDAIVGLLEDLDREAGYQASKLVTQSQGARRLAAWPGFDELVDGLTLVCPPSLFVNIPGSQRLLYRWHREAHYYPKRRRFVNVWMPLFRTKHAGNGTMAFALGGHLLGDLPFAEYAGYDDTDVGKANHFVQYEIPESFIAGCEIHHVHASPGDMISFCPDTVHTSTPNTSHEISYAAVLRVWNPTDDLTLSADLAATPYGGDYGRPGLVVEGALNA